jgi:hypothetical protein
MYSGTFLKIRVLPYWLLEEAKLQRMPAEKSLARQVIAVIGAGSGIIALDGAVDWTQQPCVGSRLRSTG